MTGSTPTGTGTGTGIGTLETVVLDCPDPRSLGEFYAAIVGGKLDADDPDWTTLRDDSGAVISFQRAQEWAPPIWPGADRPQQAHIDITVADLDAAEAQVLALGARKHEHQPGTSFRVFLDPAGHPFCLCAA
ncbi:VOC family protein [Actinopolymorpha pittospori]